MIRIICDPCPSVTYKIPLTTFDRSIYQRTEEITPFLPLMTQSEKAWEDLACVKPWMLPDQKHYWLLLIPLQHNWFIKGGEQNVGDDPSSHDFRGVMYRFLFQTVPNYAEKVAFLTNGNPHYKCKFSSCLTFFTREFNQTSYFLSIWCINIRIIFDPCPWVHIMQYSTTFDRSYNEISEKASKFERRYPI